MGIQDLNLALRFVLEIGALVALGHWGFQSGTSPTSRLLLGIGAPLLAALLWGTFVAPKAQVQVPLVARTLLALVVLGAGGFALAVTGRQVLAATFIALVLVNTALMLIWQQ